MEVVFDIDHNIAECLEIGVDASDSVRQTDCLDIPLNNNNSNFNFNLGNNKVENIIVQEHAYSTFVTESENMVINSSEIPSQNVSDNLSENLYKDLSQVEASNPFNDQDNLLEEVKDIFLSEEEPINDYEQSSILQDISNDSSVNSNVLIHQRRKRNAEKHVGFLKGIGVSKKDLDPREQKMYAQIKK